MSRAVEVGGRQGRGNPLLRRKPARPDALAVAIAAHLIETTAEAAGSVGAQPRLNPHSPYGGNVVAWWLVMDARLKDLRDKAASYAAARPWRPWWPGAARHWRGNVECGCGDCRAYVMEGGEGFTGRNGAHYPSQPAAWLAAGGVPMHRPRVAA